jgi:nitrite reductase/ring-hydroxylating ferredoxin subunit
MSQRLCTLDQLTQAGLLEAEANLPEGPESLVLIAQDDGVRAYLNVCPHAGRRLDWAPGKFLLEGGRLVCAAHGASFQLHDGLCVGGPCRGQSLKSVPVQVVEGEVRLASD